MQGGAPRLQSHNFLTGEGVDIIFRLSLVFGRTFRIASVIGFQRELLFVSRRYGVNQLLFRELRKVDARKRKMFAFGHRKSSDSRLAVAIAGYKDLFWGLRHQIPR